MALDLANGSELWSVELPPVHPYRMVYGVGASPLVVDGLVYVPVSVRDGRNGFAYDAETGEMVWSLRGGWVDYQAAHRSGDAILAVDTNELRWIDPKSGAVRARATHQRGRGSLAYPQLRHLSGDRILLSYERETALHACEPGGDPALRALWRSRELKDCYIAPALIGDTLYGMSGTFTVAVDVATGKRRWKSRQPGARGLLVVGDHLVLFSSAGDVVVAAADPQRYVEIDRVNVAERGGYTAPVMAGRRIFVRNTSGLYAVEVTPSEAVPENAGTSVTGDGSRPDGAFGAFLASLDRDGDHDARLEEWLSQQDSFPLVEGGSVHFVYRGDAEDVALVGDMTLDQHVPLSMRRVPGTDLFYRSQRVVPGGLWQYAFLVDYDREVADPRNPLTALAVTEIGGNPQLVGYDTARHQSVVRMPGFEFPDFLESRTGAGRVERLKLPARQRREARELEVYVPAAYDRGGTLPVLYVLGSGWFEHGRLATALDHLMGRRCASALVVAVPFDPGSRDRLDAGEYATMMVRDVLPRIESRYRTAACTVYGTADNASPALLLACRDPERFPRVAVQSPFVDPEDFALLEAAPGCPKAAYVDWSRFEPVIRDENVDYRSTAARVVEFLERRGCAPTGGEVPAGPGWPSWSSRLDRVLEVLLPR